MEQYAIAKQSHNVDLFKTQQPFQGDEVGEVLVLVNYFKYGDNRSCLDTTFPSTQIRLTRDHILSTNSARLKEDLENESYQHQAKKALAPLPKGVKYVLNITPSTEEDEYAFALQRLSITTGIKLWHRAMDTLGVSAAAVLGHDDSCGCNEQWDAPDIMQGPPESIQGAKVLENMNMAAYLFDTEAWSIDKHYDINEFCLVRQTANLVRLFRSLADKDLHIDSAPRLWTLVGLFEILEMKNYDLLRDQVIAWFNDSNNFTFVELLPEETIRIATILKAPALSEPAFRILVNERALMVAGGSTQRKNITIFGRKFSDCLTGTDDMEEIAQKIEHAGVAMADRYKTAIDSLCSGNALSILSVQEWDRLIAVGNILPSGQAVTNSYNNLLDRIRIEFREAIEKTIRKPASRLPTDVVVQGKDEDIDAALSYSVPKSELDDGRSFEAVYATLNRAQRALCPMVWLGLRQLRMTDFPNLRGIRRAALLFSMDLHSARMQRKLLGPYYLEDDEFEGDFISRLFIRAISNLKDFVEPLIDRRGIDFDYVFNPHMVLCLNEQEMGYICYDDDIPEAQLGPSGPGPSYHTGITIPSTSEALSEDMENLAIDTDDSDVSTVLGSVVVQDGISTVYDRRQILTPSTSTASEGFTDAAMSAEYAEAEVSVPAAVQPVAQVHGSLVGTQQEDVDDIYGVSDDEGTPASEGEDVPEEVDTDEDDYDVDFTFAL